MSRGRHARRAFHPPPRSQGTAQILLALPDEDVAVLRLGMSTLDALRLICIKGGELYRKDPARVAQVNRNVKGLQIAILALLQAHEVSATGQSTESEPDKEVG